MCFIWRQTAQCHSIFVVCVLRPLDDSSASRINIVWDEPIKAIDTEGNLREDITEGIQVRISLGNAASFDTRLIKEMNIPLTNTSVSADSSDQSTEARCRIATGTNEPCAPPHKMKYYTQVRVYTNDGKVAWLHFQPILGQFLQNALIDSTWMTFLVRFVELYVLSWNQLLQQTLTIRMPLQD